MSYWVEDNKGKWVMDLATNAGIIAMYDDKTLPESVKEFIDKGEADKELSDQMIKDLEEVEDYSFVRNGLLKLKENRFPIIITDGVS